MSATITLVGNLTADPTLRFTATGAAVANFTVASTPRTYDKQAGEWKDGESTFLDCSVWRETAENVAETLTKGMRVIVTGKLKSRSYDDRDGNRRTVFEVDVDEVGQSLKQATAKGARGRPQAGQTPPETRESPARGASSRRQTPSWSKPRAKPFSKPQQGPPGDPWAQPGTLMDEPPY